MLIYFDLDGVLTDLYGDISRATGVSVTELYAGPERTHELFLAWVEDPARPERERGWENTFAKLTPNRLEEFRALMRSLYERGHQLEILTSAGTGDPKTLARTAAVHLGKARWLWEHYGDLITEGVLSHFNVVTSSRQKALYAHRGSLLIDDDLSNTSEFSKAGGWAVWYHGPAHDDGVARFEKSLKIGLGFSEED